MTLVAFVLKTGLARQWGGGGGYVWHHLSTNDDVRLLRYFIETANLPVSSLPLNDHSLCYLRLLIQYIAANLLTIQSFVMAWRSVCTWTDTCSWRSQDVEKLDHLCQSARHVMMMTCMHLFQVFLPCMFICFWYHFC